MTDIGAYSVRIVTQIAGKQDAILSPATAADLPENWACNWPTFWENTDFELGSIVKLEYQNQVWGLMRYILYPYPGVPETLEIENLEANPASRGQQANQLIAPIGKWLIWYAAQVSLRYCSGGSSDTLTFLISLDAAFKYYREIIEMEYVGQTTIAPGEDGYVFKFSREKATQFCWKHEQQWGVPLLVNA